MSIATRRALIVTALITSVGVPVALLTPPGEAAQAQESAPAAAKIDAKARAVMTEMAAAYKTLKSYSDTVDLQGNGGPDMPRIQGTIAYQKPNRAVVTAKVKGAEMKAVANGVNVFLTSSEEKTKYRKLPSPPGEQAIQTAISGGGAAGLGLMPLLIAGGDALAPLSRSLKTLALGESTNVAGAAVEAVVATLAGPQGEATITFFVGKEDRLLRRLTLAQTMNGKAVTLTETHSDVKINPALTAAAFAFTPPQGATAVTEEAQPQMYDARLKPGAKPFAFTAKDLSGKPLTLNQYKGKVVLVDFWATWCGPCIDEMPNVIAAYNKYRGKGFDIVGISLDRPEDRAKLVAFTKENKMPWRQVYDGKFWQAAVAQQYGVRAIPFTLLLDRTGAIAAVNPRGEALDLAIRAALAK